MKIGQPKLSERNSQKPGLVVVPASHCKQRYSRSEDYELKGSIIIIMLLQQFMDIFACGKCELTTCPISDQFSPIGSFTNECHQDYLPAGKSSIDLPIAPTVVFVELHPREE
jgi:hypothetical protein